MSLDREGCRDLVLAVFRLAVCDCLGQRYGYDRPVSNQCLRAPVPESRRTAEGFLAGPWAMHLAEMAGFAARTVWLETRAMAVPAVPDECQRH